MGTRGGKIRAEKDLPLKTAGKRPVVEGELADDRLHRYARWQETLAALGQIALASTNLYQLMAQTVRRLADALQIEYVAVLELDLKRSSFLLRAGHGWRKGAIGRNKIDASSKSQFGFALIANEPVVIADHRKDKRFTPSPLLVNHRIVSGITIPISGQLRPFGVLGVYAGRPREFAPDEIRFLRTVASVLATAARGYEADQAQRDGAARVRAIVNTLVDGVITIDERGIVESMNPAAEEIFGYAMAEIVGKNVNLLMPEPYQNQHDAYLANYLRTGTRRIIGIGREVSGMRKDGATFPLDLAVSELQVSGKRMFTGVVRDITDRRRMEREILEAGADEQRRIGQDLHDGLCQHLAGIAFATEVLRQKLAAESAPQTTSISKVGKMIDQAITQARDLARGLQPVTLDANGLASALKALAEKIEEMFHISCLFVCDGPCQVDDNTVATHLYRIAQEAISNAVKHGKARTVIVDLVKSDGEIRLTIKDDGIGFARKTGNAHGMGLRSMDYRARVIGGSLSVQSGTTSGTTIVCRVRISEAPDKSERSGHGKEKGRNRKQQVQDSPHRKARSRKVQGRKAKDQNSRGG